jgi:hypothetical protein
MLLRRISQHIREQNWTAVCLDLAIVVFGVFLGIQFANWNAARVDAQAERTILERLRTDVAEFRARDAMTIALFLGARQDNMMSARRLMFGVDDRAELSHDECQAIGLSHYPLIGVRDLIILDELKATGQMSLIRDPEIVRATSRLSEIWQSGQSLEESNRSKVTVLSHAFPTYVAMDIEQQNVTLGISEIDEYDAVYRCDFDAMRADPAFRNAFGENVTLQFTLNEFSVEPARQALVELSDALDRALGDTQLQESPS